ncbi:MAG: spore maturation protein [Clostridiales bacterium]|jgi:spore maturation protein B|nr:spore maturation protein [Clostridiales bacterium]
MELMLFLSYLIMPTMFIIIITYGFLQKVNIFDAFIEGAFSGAKTVFSIFPTFLGLMLAVTLLSSSGTLEIISKLLKPLCNLVGLPSETIPLIFMRLVSSSASTSLLLDIFKNYGPDSFVGKFVSIMMSCTETVFYTMSVYFISVKITKTKYTLAGALIANLAGVIASLYITRFLF